jgi:hypothetical protein
MKSTKKALMVLTALVAAVGILAGCASAPKTAEQASASVEVTQKTIVLDDKGAAFGIQTPTWVTAYVMGGSNLAVEALPEYKGNYCFVIETNDANRDYAINWVTNANGPAAVAQKVSTTVSSSASTQLSGEKGSGVESNLKAATEALSNASFRGVTKTGDWWQIVHNEGTDVTECRAYALYIIEKKLLDEQVAANMQNVVDNNKAMSEAERAIYVDLINSIRANGGINS